VSDGEGAATTARHKYTLRCHACLSSEIAGVCHHCALPFCAQHLPGVRRRWYRIDSEYQGLELPETDSNIAVHCSRHFHQRFNWRPFYRSAAMFVLALLLPTFYLIQRGLPATAPLFALFALSAGVFGLGFAADLIEEMSSEPPLPLFGRGPSLELREVVSGQLLLERDGAYKVTTARTTGRIDFRVAPDGGEDRRRKALTRRYYRRSHTRHSAHAGFLALMGQADIALQGAEIADLETRPHLLELSRTVADHPFFPLDGAPQRYTLTPQYHFVLDGGLPVRLLPALVSTENALGLELTVQVRTGRPQLLTGANVVVKELVLCAQPQLGPIMSRRPAAMAPGDETHCTESNYRPALSWHNVELLPDAEAPPLTAKTPGVHRTFFARFERDELLSYSTVMGHLVLLVENHLLSGLNGALFFSPLGRRREDLSYVSHTEIRVNFRLELDSLLITTPYDVEKKRQYPGTASFESVLSLSNQLLAIGHYVKQVVEHTSGVLERDDAREVDRSWTVAGRSYRGVFPIDYEINVSCPELKPLRHDGEVVMIQLRASALVGRGARLEMLGSTVTQLLTVCDQVFGAGISPRWGQPLQPPSGPAAPSPGVGPLRPFSGAAPPPGFAPWRAD
jgi:hypothetical protein